jgi:diguanylate cyclase
MTWPFRRDPSTKKQTTRTRIFVWALLICSLIGAIQLPLPLEDVLQGLRNQVRARPADQSVVVVAIDPKTIRAYGSSRFSRQYYADMLNQAAAAGAKRVYFDEAFSQQQDAEGDNLFAEALSKHRGKAFVGALTLRNRDTGEQEDVVPLPLIQNQALVRSLNGIATPFSLSAELVYADDFNGQQFPSISADISGRAGPVGERYRPDWTIQGKSVPTVSFVDLANGAVPAAKLSGKDVIVGVTTEPTDFVQIYGQQWFPGVYVHAVGAQTLKEGQPIDVGWIPAMLVAAVLSAAFIRARSQRTAGAIVAIAVALVLVVPFILDMVLLSAHFIAACLMFGIVAYRATALRFINEARLKNAGSLLPNLSALREEATAADRPIIAMRIRNYAAVCASFSTPVEDELVTELARRLTLPKDPTTFYQAEDVLYWLAPTLSSAELEDHLSGLARIIESHFEIRGRKLDIHVAFGVEMDLSRPVANRIGRALLAADNAASKQQMFQFSTSTSDEDAAWELSLMSELDNAIDTGDIWVAYQPQYDLRDDTIIGAEALVRWQHPTRGAISPEAFVLSAEAHNRIKRLTFHILEQSTRAAKPLLLLNPRFRLSVNMSASLLELQQLPAQIAQVLIQTGFPAHNLTLEVTESAPFSEHDIIAINLAGIAAIGIDLSIDDYGTGNATLEYLRSIPCQEIKIDRRFVGGLVTNANDMMLVESTIDLAHGMGRRVIAEGIENPETLEILRAIGCDIAQGYYLAKPMRFEALETLLEAEVKSKAA